MPESIDLATSCAGALVGTGVSRGAAVGTGEGVTSSCWASGTTGSGVDASGVEVAARVSGSGVGVKSGVGSGIGAGVGSGVDNSVGVDAGSGVGWCAEVVGKESGTATRSARTSASATAATRRSLIVELWLPTSTLILFPHSSSS